MRAATEATLGRADLARTARDGHRGPGRFSPRRRTGATRDGVFLPHGPGVNQALVGSRREAAARHAAQADVEHLALGILAVSEGLVPSILSRLGTSGPALCTAILDRYPARKPLRRDTNVWLDLVAETQAWLRMMADGSGQRANDKGSLCETLLESFTLHNVHYRHYGRGGWLGLTGRSVPCQRTCRLTAILSFRMSS